MDDGKRYCQECGELRDKDDFTWTYDRYGIPYKKVCCNCYSKVDAEIKGWEYNPETGEYLESEQAY